MGTSEQQNTLVEGIGQPMSIWEMHTMLRDKMMQKTESPGTTTPENRAPAQPEGAASPG